MLTPKTWLAKADAALEPARGLVDLLLIGIAAAAIALLFVRSNALRTAAVVWMLAP